MRSYGLVIGALVAVLAHGPASAGEWSCGSENAGTKVLAFRGGIGSAAPQKEGEAQRFAKAFDACFPRNFAGQRVVDLSSGGGDVDEALKIARAIAQVGASRPIQTRVSGGSVCISACTYLFVAGQFRDVATGGSFEPHGFSAYMGTPIDRVLEEAARRKQAPLDVLQINRLLAWAPWLSILAKNDARFDFAREWLGLSGRNIQNATVDGVVRMLQGLESLTPAQRQFISQLDAVVRVAVPELERSAALFALESAFAGGSPRTQGTLPDEERFFRWIVGEMDGAARRYLRSLKDTREPKWGDEFGAAVLFKVRERTAETLQLMNSKLWPYIASRRDIVNEGFLRLMFSTSILYTRPLTREEMCAFNIVNENCFE